MEFYQALLEKLELEMEVKPFTRCQTREKRTNSVLNIFSLPIPQQDQEGPLETLYASLKNTFYSLVIHVDPDTQIDMFCNSILLFVA